MSRRITSLVKIRSRRAQYQPWEEEEEDEKVSDQALLAAKPVVELTALSTSPDEADLSQHRVLKLSSLGRGEGKETLAECFYLGSSDMTGLEIRGRGCIDKPAGTIWTQTQGEKKPKRKNSFSTKHTSTTTSSTTSTSSSNTPTSVSFKPRYVKLVAGLNSLLVTDYSTDELVIEFSYRKISFVGTHPKHTRLFAFIAESLDSTSPFCHAFKCEDKGCANQVACALSDMFSKKIKELVLQSKVHNSVGPD